jgi:hypothetical protein
VTKELVGHKWFAMVDLPAAVSPSDEAAAWAAENAANKAGNTFVDS